MDQTQLLIAGIIVLAAFTTGLIIGVRLTRK